MLRFFQLGWIRLAEADECEGIARDQPCVFLFPGTGIGQTGDPILSGQAGMVAAFRAGLKVLFEFPPVDELPTGAASDPEIIGAFAMTVKDVHDGRAPGGPRAGTEGSLEETGRPRGL